MEIPINNTKFNMLGSNSLLCKCYDKYNDIQIFSAFTVCIYVGVHFVCIDDIRTLVKYLYESIAK